MFDLHNAEQARRRIKRRRDALREPRRDDVLHCFGGMAWQIPVTCTAAGGWIPTDIGASLVGWWEAGLSSYASGNIGDLSANGNTLAQGTGSLQMAFSSGHADMNGAASWTADGGDFHQIGDLAGADLTSFTVYAVVRPTTSGASRAIFDNSGPTGGRASIYQSATNNRAQLYAEAGGDIASADNAFTTNTRCIVRGYFKNGASSLGKLWKPGVSDVTWSGSLTNPGLRGFTIGAFYTGSFGWSGQIASVILINGDYTASEDANLIPRYRTKYGITV